MKLSLRYIVYGLLALTLSTAPALASTTHQEREGFARSFANTVLTILHDRERTYSDRKDVLRRSFVKSVDMEWIAKFVLGKYWRVATPEQREQYTALYSDFLTETYIKNFAENPSKGIYSIKILGVKDSDKDDEFTVNTTMQLTNGQVLQVSYLVEELNAHYKVIDIVIENVSLIHTHRSEFSNLAAEQGVDGVNRRLTELLAEGRNSTKMSMK